MRCVNCERPIPYAALNCPYCRAQQPAVVERTGTDGLGMTVETIDYDKLDQPAVVRRRSPSVGGAAAGASDIEIPAFLRKQAD